jgi:predicted HicB family RNase H-like nuclease
MPAKKKAKKVSGPSGKNTKPGIMLRMDPKVLENLRRAAKRRGLTLTRWILDACERLYIYEGVGRNP